SVRNRHRGGARRAFFASVKALPNMRVQRTRVLLPAVARRSPLTRHPLGGRSRLVCRMRAIGTWLVAIVATVCGAGVAFSADAYVVRYDTTRAAAPFPPCGALVYRDELIFQNAGAADAQVLLLGVSNGIAANPQALVVPAGKVRSSEGYCEGCSAASTWAPDPQPLLWVAHLDIPEQVKVISRLLVLAGSPEVCNGFPGTSAHTYAGI